MIYYHPPRVRERPSWGVTILEILLVTAIAALVFGGMLIGKATSG